MDIEFVGIEKSFTHFNNENKRFADYVSIKENQLELFSHK